MDFDVSTFSWHRSIRQPNKKHFMNMMSNANRGVPGIAEAAVDAMNWFGWRGVGGRGRDK